VTPLYILIWPTLYTLVVSVAFRLLYYRYGGRTFVKIRKFFHELSSIVFHLTLATTDYNASK